MSMDLEMFRNLPTADVAQLVRDGGTRVCVFPINGTRRWFMMEHLSEKEKDFASAYLDASGRGHVELYQLLFDHGLDTLLTPVFGPDLLKRGIGYMQVVVEGLSRLATHPDFLNFYEAYGVRVRFYGDYRKFFGSTAYASCLVDLFDEVMARTAMHDRHRLFFGVCAQDATETIAEQVIHYYAEHGHVPDKRTLIELYYGEYVEPVGLFIGFDKPSVFDMHLVATGNEDLYFTVSPSLYLNQRQLRDILYDHLYTRREQAPDYSAIGANDWALIKEFYRANRERTLGVGARQKNGGFWYPLPQVELPPGFVEPRN